MPRSDGRETNTSFTTVLDEYGFPVNEHWNPPARENCAACGLFFADSRPRYPYRVYQFAPNIQLCVTCVAFCTECEDVVFVNVYDTIRPLMRSVNTFEEATLWARFKVPYCSRCRAVCDHCGAPHHMDDLTEVQTRFEWAQVCDNCVGECDECGSYIISSLQYCRNCQRENGYREIAPGVHDRLNYGYKPKPRFHGAENNPYPNLFIGIEQELEPRRDFTSWDAMSCAKEIADELDPNGLLYFKEDGSLDEGGIEIVSHPMSIPFFREEYPWDMWKPGEGIGKYYRQTGNTGIHVHVSKAAFTKAHAYRFNAFHFLYPDFVELVAGRSSNHYTEMRPYELRTSSSRETTSRLVTKFSAIAKGKDYSDSRYWGVNSQNNATYELRYFRSTVDARRLRFYADWLEALYLYTNEGWIRSRKADRILTPHNMRKWCEAQDSGKFESLTRFLVTQDI